VRVVGTQAITMINQYEQTHKEAASTALEIGSGEVLMRIGEGMVTVAMLTNGVEGW
jgi:DNA-binding protein YbaB